MYRQGQVLVPWQCVDNTAMIPRQLVLVSEEIETSLKRHMIYRDDSANKAKPLFHGNATIIPQTRPSPCSMAMRRRYREDTAPP